MFDAKIVEIFAKTHDVIGPIRSTLADNEFGRRRGQLSMTHQNFSAVSGKGHLSMRSIVAGNDISVSQSLG